MSKTWLDEFEKEEGLSFEYVSELLMLQVNRAIRERMHLTGITQEDLAEKLGVSQPRVSRLLNYNQNLTLRSLAQISAVLECQCTLTFSPQSIAEEYDHLETPFSVSSSISGVIENEYDNGFPLAA